MRIVAMACRAVQEALRVGILLQPVVAPAASGSTLANRPQNARHGSKGRSRILSVASMKFWRKSNEKFQRLAAIQKASAADKVVEAAVWVSANRRPVACAAAVKSQTRELLEEEVDRRPV